MAQRVVGPKLSGPEAGRSSLHSDGKQLLVAGRKTPLRDLQSENNVLVLKSTGSSVIPKEGEASADCAKVSGTKQPSVEPQAHSSHHQCPIGNSVNGHLVYVRRKSETEASKNSTDEAIVDNINNNNNGDCSKPKQSIPQQVTVQEKSHVKEESRVLCLPALASIPNASSTSSSSGKPSVPLPLGKPVTRSVPAEAHSHSGASSVPTSDQKIMNNQNWEERYFQLQMFLKKLDDSSLEEYIEKLQALSPAELNKHAVELEKRTIQLSVEEGIELQRVRALDVLGKSRNTTITPMGSTARATPDERLGQRE